MRDMAALRSARHAARLREVITSEEACEAERTWLRSRLGGAALQRLGLMVRAARAQREGEACRVQAGVLSRELGVVEGVLWASEASRRSQAAAAALAASAAESEVRVLREQVQGVATKQREWRAALASKRSDEV